MDSKHQSHSSDHGLQLREWVKKIRNSFWPPALGYLAALAIAQILTSHPSPASAPAAGLFLFGIILALLLGHAALSTQGPRKRFLISLALIPLLRLLGLSLPLQNFPAVFWSLVIGVPLSIAAYLAFRQGRLNTGMLGLTRRGLPLQILVGLTGIGLGYIYYQIERPSPLVEGLHWEQILLPALILLLFTGLLEEIIFRGAIQYASLQNLGRFGLLYPIAVFLLPYLGYRPAFELLFVTAVALFFGWVTLRSGSIIGVSLAHGLLNISMFLVFPILLAGAANLPQANSLPAGQLLPPPVAVITKEIPETGTLSASQAGATGETSLERPLQTPPETQAETQTALQSIPTSETPLSASLIFVPVAGSVNTPAAVEPSTSPQAAAQAQVPAQPRTCRPPAGWVTYRITAGDTLSGLSLRYRTSMVGLQQANCLNKNSRIYAGQLLFVPYFISAQTAAPLLSPTPIPTRTVTPVPTGLPMPTQTASQTPPPPTVEPAETSQPATLPPSETPADTPTAPPTAPPTEAPTEAPTAAPTATVPPATEPAPTEAPTSTPEFPPPGWIEPTDVPTAPPAG